MSCNPCCAGKRSVLASCARGAGVCPGLAESGCTGCEKCTAEAFIDNARSIFAKRSPPTVTVAAPMGLYPALKRDPVEALVDLVKNEKARRTTTVVYPKNATDPKGVSGTRQRARSSGPSNSASAGAGGSVSAKNGPGTNDFRRTGILGGGRRRTNRRTHKKSRKLKRRHTRSAY